eukprot:8484077-Pyramimonas_sp.AAC.1
MPSQGSTALVPPGAPRVAPQATRPLVTNRARGGEEYTMRVTNHARGGEEYTMRVTTRARGGEEYTAR